MYARQPPDGRFPRNVRIPRNYSGNAFRQEEEMPPPTVVAEESRETKLPPASPPPSPSEEEVKEAPAEPSAAASVGKLFPSPGFRLDLGRFLNRGRGGGIGFEELLIIGLIFLLSQSETKDDLVFLLLLLLFIQ